MNSKTAICFAFGCVQSFAAAIMVPEPKVTTECEVAGQSVGCGYNDGSTKAMTRTSATISGFGANHIFLNLDAYAEAGTWNFNAQRTSSSALALINLDFLASTDGPQRPGLMTYSLVADGDHGAGGGASATAYVEGLAACQYPACHNAGTLVPFTLGTVFSISMFARGFGGSGVHALDGGEGYTYISLSLFDVFGNPVNIYDPVAIPEPSTGLLVLAVLALLAAARTKVRHA